MDIDKILNLMYNLNMNTNDEKILHLYQQGIGVKEIIQKTGLSRSKVYQVIHNEKNKIVPKYQKRGRKTGEKRLLTPEQEQKLYQQLITTKPDAYFLPNASNVQVWTRKNIQALIGTYDIQVSDHSVSNYLKRFQLVYNKPEIKIERETLCLSVVNLNSNNQVYNRIQKQIFSGCNDVCMIYAYDSRGTYYFCVYVENTLRNNENNPILSRIYDFLNRTGKQYRCIHCYTPHEKYSSDFSDIWNKKYYKIKGKLNFYKLSQENKTI